jgi:hypothetical protein
VKILDANLGFLKIIRVILGHGSVTQMKELMPFVIVNHDYQLDCIEKCLGD